MTFSPLISYTHLSPNHYYGRGGRRITKITPHHMAGDLSVETCGRVFESPSREASSNYGIGTDGRIAGYVREEDTAWTSSSYANDSQSITIEVANSSIGGMWPVSDAAWNSLVDLCVDICQRNGIPGLTYTGDASGNLTNHDMFAPTGCPGPYLKQRMPELAAAVNEKLNNGWTPSIPNPSIPEYVGDFHCYLQAKTVNGLILPAVADAEDDAGIDEPMGYLAAWANPGYLTAQARTEASGWLPILTDPSNISDPINGCIGDGSPITGIKLYYHSPNADHAVHYRVKTEASGWLPWMIDNYDTSGSSDDFAGDGSRIQRIEAYIQAL